MFVHNVYILNEKKLYKKQICCFVFLQSWKNKIFVKNIEKNELKIYNINKDALTLLIVLFIGGRKI